MNCPSCRHVNAPERNFCGACGAPLAAYCPRCGFRNRAADRYCGGCGQPLGGTAAAEGRTAVADGAPAPPQDELGELLAAAQEAEFGEAGGEDVRVTQEDIDRLFGD